MKFIFSNEIALKKKRIVDFALNLFYCFKGELKKKLACLKLKKIKRAINLKKQKKKMNNKGINLLKELFISSNPNHKNYLDNYNVIKKYIKTEITKFFTTKAKK